MKNKFKGLRTAIDGAVEDGIDGIVCMSPSALGDNYEEICENLSIIANNGLAVGFIKNENYGKVIPDPQPTPLSSLGLADMNTCETCKHWNETRRAGFGTCLIMNPFEPSDGSATNEVYLEAEYYSTGASGTILPGKDFGCIHWEENPHQQRIKCAEGFFNESEITKAIDRMGGVFMMVDSQTNVIVQARNKDWIGHEFEPEIHIPPNSKENP